ncbi:SAV_915 family protein [Streptomyces termitum]|uniref:SAV_915 family protein n=1 Tax=Streptomyces termitum TaxID=67368 RepID=UPI00379785E2
MPRTPLPGPDEPGPGEPAPAGHLCVPVRPGAHGVTARLFRTPVGARTAVGFTTPGRLRATLGAGQPWIPLSEPALRALARPLGIRALTVDPTLTAPGAAPARGPAAVREPAPAPVPASGLLSPRGLPGPHAAAPVFRSPCARRESPAELGAREAGS